MPPVRPGDFVREGMDFQDESVIDVREILVVVAA